MTVLTLCQWCEKLIKNELIKYKQHKLKSYENSKSVLEICVGVEELLYFTEISRMAQPCSSDLVSACILKQSDSSASSIFLQTDVEVIIKTSVER